MPKKNNVKFKPEPEQRTRLTAQELHNKDKEKHRQNKLIYKSILVDCEKRIRHYNLLGNKQTVLSVPYMKFDTPLYDVTHAMMYVMKKLKENGFVIANVHENRIHVTW